MWFVDGLVFEGQWVNNNMHGSGKMVYDTGAVFEGDFVAGMRHGTGTLTYANSDVYVGGWAEDNKEGQGVFTFNSDGGSTYDGQWLAGVMHGSGTYTFADGCRFEGMYMDGRRHGKGVFVNADGSSEPGEWKLGKKVRVRVSPPKKAAVDVEAGADAQNLSAVVAQAERERDEAEQPVASLVAGAKRAKARTSRDRTASRKL